MKKSIFCMSAVIMKIEKKLPFTIALKYGVLGDWFSKVCAWKSQNLEKSILYAPLVLTLRDSYHQSPHTTGYWLLTSQLLFDYVETLYPIFNA